jgi:uncharacterized protein (TIGR03437 family)
VIAIAAAALYTASAASAAVLPIAFEPNRGQASGDYVARGSGMTVALESDRVEFIGRGSRVVTILNGARHGVRPEPEQPLPGVTHYLKGNDRSRWITDIPTYGRLRYRGIYPGIDAIYYGKDGRLEYDFVIAPGANPRRIALHYDGGSARVDASGDLVLGKLRQHRPVVYQVIGGQRREIAARYALRGQTVRFELGTYDRTRELVIDPAVTWATYFGSSGSETGEAVAVDANGNIYLAGTSFGPSGYGDVLFAKLTPDGTSALFTGIFGGSYDNECHGIAVDASGNIYLAGETNSPDFPASSSLTVSPGYNGDAFISKIDATGKSLVYSSYLGGSGQEIAYAIALDKSNSAYITGATVSPDFPVSRGTAQTTQAGGVDAFVTKFDANGNGVYSTFLGGAGDDYGFAIAADSSGDVYVTGSTTSTGFPTTQSAFQAKLAGATDAFVTKLSPTGTIVYSTYLGGSGDEDAFAIALDSGGAAYITGQTASADFPTLNAAQSKLAGTSNMFVAKVNGDGASLAYSTYLGGSGADAGNGIAVDTAGSAYVIGTATSTDFPLADAFQSKNAGASNAVVASLDAGGAVQFASYLGGSGTSSTNGDFGGAVAVSCASGLIALGSTTSSDFPATSGAFQKTSQGGSDAFVAKIAAGGMPAIAATGIVSTASLTAGPLAPGSLISIPGSSLTGGTVTLNGNTVAALSTRAGQIDLQLPFETPAGAATVSVAGPCGATPPVTFQVVPAAPYVRQTASGDAAAMNQDATVNSVSNPAKTGSVIVVTLTGIGPVDNAVPTGAKTPSSPLSNATLPFSATVGGWDSPVQFLGLTPGTVGWAQANLVVPGLSSGAYPVVVTVNGVASNGATVYVQ